MISLSAIRRMSARKQWRRCPRNTAMNRKGAGKRGDGLEATDDTERGSHHLNDRGYWSLRSAIIGTTLTGLPRHAFHLA